MLRIIQNRRVFYAVSAALFVACFAALAAWGLKPGIDFTGGSLLELEFVGASRPESDRLVEAVRGVVTEGEIFVQPIGENSAVVRMPNLAEDEHQELLVKLKAEFGKDGASVEESRFESIGPLIGAELRKKTVYAVIGAILAIVLYITYAFRKVSHPIASWKYGVVTVVALLHDVAIPAGLFAYLGHYYGVEVGAWIVTALLTILGFSVHDTIVVFDRIRERLSHRGRESFEELVNQSVNETLARSINTSLTVLLVLAAAYFFGGESIKHFVLAMLVGIGAGTYSSIFVASPLLVSWHLRDKKR